MIALKSINKQSLVNFEDLLFMLVDKHESSDYSQLYYVDAIIINSTDNVVFESVLKGVRKHYNPNIYLKPVFAVESDQVNSIYKDCCDHLTDPHAYEVVAERTRFINKRIEKLFQLQRFPTPEMEFLYKTLQFLYTRDTPLRPIPNRFSKINYHFPFISWQFADADLPAMLKVIETGKHEGYLSTTVLDKVHLCSNCGSAHHNIRETCPKCKSINLEVEDLIHHFQCAYVGPESDFQQENSDALVCPKCAKIVRHIGIDYDKPSHIYRCKGCNDSFQEAQFTSNCMDCKEIKDIRHLEEKPVESLHITSKGTQLVMRGLPKTEEGSAKPISNTVTGIYSWEIFQHLLKQEEARARQHHINSVLGRIVIYDEGINQLSSRDVSRLQNELAKVLKSYMQECDLVCPKSPSQYYFILTNTNKASAAHVKQMVEYNFKELLKGNLEASDPDVTVDLINLGDAHEAPLSIDDMN